MNTKRDVFLLVLCTTLLITQIVTATGYHIPTVSEGLLNSTGCYIGAYLGGEQGANNNKCVNYYATTSGNPYETQILDHPLQYGEKNTGDIPGELKATDTGIDVFRAGADSIHAGAGKKQLLFSRYFNLKDYPDNNYGKIIYFESPPPYVWAEKVLQQGGIPVLILYPWSLQKDKVLDLSVQNSYHNPMTGTDIMKEIAQKCDALSRKYVDSTGKPATILICFGLEYNTQDIVNPTKDDSINDRNKQAWRKMYRDAYTIVRANANPSVQMVWASNVAQTMKDRINYWPGTDDSGKQLSQDYVDWVGMTWYPWSTGPKTLDDLAGFYSYYAKERNHPMIFMETSADGNGDSSQELILKENQVKYLYNKNNLQNYPNIKGIIWFNVIKGENNSQNVLVTKNFLLPDGAWDNHGMSQTQPGTLYSASNHDAMMNTLYPDAVMDPYFIGQSSSFSAGFNLKIHEDTMTVECVDTSTGAGIASWSWDIDGDQIPDYFTRNITHKYSSPGTYNITLIISDGQKTSTYTRTCIIPNPLDEKKSTIFIGSLPAEAQVWVDNTDYIGTTTSAAIPYLVPSGNHVITLKKSGYRPWNGAYSLKWPQNQYFGLIRLGPALQGTAAGETSSGIPDLTRSGTFLTSQKTSTPGNALDLIGHYARGEDRTEKVSPPSLVPRS